MSRYKSYWTVRAKFYGWETVYYENYKFKTKEEVFEFIKSNVGVVDMDKCKIKRHVYDTNKKSFKQKLVKWLQRSDIKGDNYG